MELDWFAMVDPGISPWDSLGIFLGFPRDPHLPRLSLENADEGEAVARRFAELREQYEEVCLGFSRGILLRGEDHGKIMGISTNYL